MPRLTELQIKNAKPKEIPYKLGDGVGLHLLVSPSKRDPESGIRTWQVRYQRGGKPALMNLGNYPELSLADARIKALEIFTQVRAGADPAQAKKIEKLVAFKTAQDTFSLVVQEWLALFQGRWTEPYFKQTQARVEQYLLPLYGALPIGQITTQMLKPLIQGIGKSNPATARKILQDIRAIFKFGQNLGALEKNHDPSWSLPQLLEPHSHIGRPGPNDIVRARELLGVIEAQDTRAYTLLAHRLMVITGLRVSEAVGARFSEVSGEHGPSPIWTIPAERMKGGREPHVVPLCTQAIEIFKAARRSATSDLLFPVRGRRRGAIPSETMNMLYFRAGLKVRGQQPEIVPHGWRSAMSTILNEAFPNDDLAIDRMLSHKPSKNGRVSSSEGAYNRSKHIDRRRELHQAWADMILEGAPSALSFMIPEAGPTVVSMPPQPSVGIAA